MLTNVEGLALGILVGPHARDTFQIVGASGIRGKGMSAKGRRLTANLLEKGFIARADNDNDAYPHLYVITPAGRKAWTEFTPSAA